MSQDDHLSSGDSPIATIENRDNPSQSIDVLYKREENAFVTSGIQDHFGEKEILIPAHLVVMDLQLIGAIVSAILEKISQAHDRDSTFSYVPRFDVLDKTYTLENYGAYVKLATAAG